MPAKRLFVGYQHAYFWKEHGTETPNLLILRWLLKIGGGERGIRTLEGFYTLHAFQASAIDHSAISPEKLLERRLFTRSRGF